MPNPPFGLFGASRTGAGGEGAGEGDGEGRRSAPFLFLPPILPNPPFVAFGASRAFGCGVAGSGDLETLGMRF